MTGYTCHDWAAWLERWNAPATPVRFLQGGEQRRLIGFELHDGTDVGRAAVLILVPGPETRDVEGLCKDLRAVPNPERVVGLAGQGHFWPLSLAGGTSWEQAGPETGTLFIHLDVKA